MIMADQYDAIVIGAGHNGLTTACYLAKAGLSVLVLENYSVIGGMTITEEITLPGFHSDIHASGYQLANFSPVPEELELEKFGLEIIKPDLAFSHSFPDGRIITVHRDIEQTAANIAEYSAWDANIWRDLSDQYLQQRNHIIAAFFTPSPSLTEIINQLAKSNAGMDNYRFSLQSVRSWCNETFEAEETKCLFGSFASFLGSSPDDVGGAELAWLFASVLQHEGNNLVKGGMHNLSLALARYLKSQGGEIRTNTKVIKILGTSNRATGVYLASGEEVKAKQLIVSGIDPAQLIIHLLGSDMVGDSLVARMQKYEWGDSVFVIYTALNQPVTYKSGEGARLSPHVHLSHAHLDALAQIYFECRAGKLPTAPLIVSWNDTTIDPSRAPAGKHLMKFVVLNVPYHITDANITGITGRHWSEVKEAYADYLIDLITENYIPDLKDKIIKRVAHSPIDMESKIISAVRGTLGQGAFLPYQRGSLRPTFELGEYKSPVPNVYLCSSGSHPGAGVSMAPGRNAVEIICRDLKIDFATLTLHNP
jgi:beta-carotene ketolase (CrtO type)